MIVILYGEDASRIEYKLDHLKQKEKPDEIIRLNASMEDAGEIFNVLDTMSLFSKKPMVIVENASFFSAKNETKIDPANLVHRDPPEKIIVYICHSKKLDTRKKAVKELMSKAKVMECMPLDEKSQPGEIKAMMKEKGMKMDQRAFDWFCLHAGYSSAQLSRQLDKLALYGEDLKLEDVKALTTVEPTHNIFKMLDALFEKDQVRLLGLYREFRFQNMEPQQIIALLSGQIRFVFQVRVMMDAGMSQQAMAEELEVSSGRIWNSMKNARRFSAADLHQNLALLSRLDQNIKSGKVDKDIGFENFVLQIRQKEN